jgi:KUP system potassium uptake protein
VPIIVGILFFAVMVLWKLGRRALAEYTRSHAEPLDAFLATVDSRVAMRVPGTAVFMTSLATDVPLILEHHLRRIGVLHAHVVLLTIVFEHVPTVPAAERLAITPLTHGFTRVVATYGFMDEPDVPALLRGGGLPCQLADATYYLGRETFLATHAGLLGPVRESIFGFLSRNAASATTYFAIPPEQVVEIGTQIDL